MSEQADTLRQEYQEIAVERDELAREVERLRGHLEVLREQYIAAETERDEATQLAEQLRASDRAVRILLVRTETEEILGEGAGLVSTTALRTALDTGRTP